MRCGTFWYFSHCDPRFGVKYPGRIPGQIPANLIHYFTQPNDLVVDLMAGHTWSPVKRIEFNRELLRSSRRLFHQMLATVRYSMIVPTIYEPLEQFLADQVVKRHTGRLPSLYQTVGVANIQDFNSDLATQLVRRFRT